MSRIRIKCPNCNVAMSGTDPEQFKKPVKCLACKNTFQVALAELPKVAPPEPKRGSFPLLTLAVLALLLGGVGVYFGLPLLSEVGKSRRGSGAGDNPVEGKRYAMLIGVNEYRNEGFTALLFAENDAVELAEVLGNAGYEVTLLTGAEGKKLPDRVPTQANIKSHLARIAKLCTKKDTLVLAFAGHGMQVGDQAYFCPTDADESKTDTMVSLHRVYAEMGESKAGARLLLVDACRNDGRRSTGVRRGITTPTVRPPSGVAALFSCKQGEFAFEKPELKHGIFFHYVLEGLRGKALTEDGEVTWDRLNEYVKRQVSRNVEKLVGGGAKQTPHAMADLEGESPVLLRDPTKRERPVEEAPKTVVTRPPVKPVVTPQTPAKPRQAWAIQVEEFDLDRARRGDVTVKVRLTPRDKGTTTAKPTGKFQLRDSKGKVLVERTPSSYSRTATLSVDKLGSGLHRLEVAYEAGEGEEKVSPTTLSSFSLTPPKVMQAWDMQLVEFDLARARKGDVSVTVKLVAKKSSSTTLLAKGKFQLKDAKGKTLAERPAGFRQATLSVKGETLGSGFHRLEVAYEPGESEEKVSPLKLDSFYLPPSKPTTPYLPKTITNSIGMKLTRIPAGKFKMGSPTTESGRNSDEKQHEVEITKYLYMGVYEVTQKQYKEIMGTNPSYFCKDGTGKSKVSGMDTDDFPVERVSWLDAQAFIKKLNARSDEKSKGREYRLPTEAEWEYACRCGRNEEPFNIDGKPVTSLSSSQANFDGGLPYGSASKGIFLQRTCKVGTYKPNAFGLYDMHGNVREWCSDYYDKDYSDATSKRDPTGPSSGTMRVARGGYWFSFGRSCRAAERYKHSPSTPANSIGFRVVLIAPSK